MKCFRTIGIPSLDVLTSTRLIVLDITCHQPHNLSVLLYLPALPFSFLSFPFLSFRYLVIYVMESHHYIHPNILTIFGDSSTICINSCTIQEIYINFDSYIISVGSHAALTVPCTVTMSMCFYCHYDGEYVRTLHSFASHTNVQTCSYYKIPLYLLCQILII